MFIYNLTQYVTDSYVLRLRAQNGMWAKFYNFWPKHDDEKRSRKNIF